MPRQTVLSLAIACSGCAAPAVPTVILTTDVGTETDDQWALAYLALLDEAGVIDLAGIVTTHAPSFPAPAAESSAAAAREVLGVLELRSPPQVIAGESVPLDPGGGIPGGAGARFIVRTARALGPTERLTVLSIGAATDVAEAFLLDPSIADRMRVIAMAFDGWPRGGDPYNVKNDPRAFEVILSSGVPLTIGASDVCLRHLTLDRPAAEKITSRGGRAGRYLLEAFERWLADHPDVCKQYTGHDAWPIWDLVTVASLLGFTAEDVRPRPRLRADLTFDLGEPQGEMRWITAVDEARLWADFEQRLEQGSGVPRARG